MLDFVSHGVPSPTARPAAGQVDGSAESLIDAIGPVDGDRLLLVGASTLEIMCAAIRRGAEGVSTLRTSEKPEAASADLAFVAASAAAELAHPGHACSSLSARMMRALVPLGSLAVHLDETAADGLAFQISRALRQHGFSAIRIRSLRDGSVLLRAERPHTGSLAQV